MDIGFLAILVTIFKAAEKIGLVDHLKKLPEKTFDGLFEKFVQDKAAENKYLKHLFTPKVKKIFDDAFGAIAPENTALKRRFLLAILTEPEIVKVQQNLGLGQLPTRTMLVPVFKKALDKNDVSEIVDNFIDRLYADLSKNQEAVNLVMLTLVERMSGQTELLLEIRDKIGAKEIAIPDKEPKFKIHTAKLPTTGSDLFGREQELKMFDQAWGEPHTNIVSLVAFGGVGKSALVNAWLNNLEKDNYRGAERVYGWSFYSQGTREERQVSADEFFNDALDWFGYTGDPILSPWDKGKKLAELVKEKRTLLILDGLEPLQYPPGEMQGHLKDQGVQALLKDLARANPGLCVISTRLQVEDLEGLAGSKRQDLENLSPEAGAQLLQKLGVNGTQKELTKVVKEYDGHALALNLLGNFLKAVHGGEIRKRDKIAKLSGLKKHQGRHARRVMTSYEAWFRAGAKLTAESGLVKITSTGEHDSAELNILYLMGLFDRPAEPGAIAALRKEPAINGLTDLLQNLSQDDWQLAVSNLRDLHLLAAEEDTRPDTLDCHPLVREHFGDRLKQVQSESWKKAHSRLYEHYKTQAPENPNTLKEMEPLFAAVAHGCMAGRHQETLDKVFWPRIRKGNEQFSYHRLGAFGADLAALANFFDQPWQKPATDLMDTNKAVMLSWVGFGFAGSGAVA